jgi:hypothetical protein
MLAVGLEPVTLRSKRQLTQLSHRARHYGWRLLLVEPAAVAAGISYCNFTSHLQP